MKLESLRINQTEKTKNPIVNKLLISKERRNLALSNVYLGIFFFSYGLVLNRPMQLAKFRARGMSIVRYIGMLYSVF